MVVKNNEVPIKLKAGSKQELEILKTKFTDMLDRWVSNQKDKERSYEINVDEDNLELNIVSYIEE